MFPIEPPLPSLPIPSLEVITVAPAPGTAVLMHHEPGLGDLFTCE